jgi:hypothetical protein
MPSLILSWPRVLASIEAYPEPLLRQAIFDVISSDPELLSPTMAAGQLQVVEAVLRVLKESIREQNADKAYFLRKLQAANEAADAISDYLSYLADKSKQLAEQEKGKENAAYTCPPRAPSKSWMIGLPTAYIPRRPRKVL